MDISKYKYWVNLYAFVKAEQTTVRRTGDLTLITLEFDDACLYDKFGSMFRYDDTLFVIPGEFLLSELVEVGSSDTDLYYIKLKSTDTLYYAPETASLKEVESWEVYDELHGSSLEAEIHVKDDGDDTSEFSIPTLFGVRINQDGYLAPAPHTDDPGERGEQGSADTLPNIWSQASLTNCLVGFFAKSLENWRWERGIADAPKLSTEQINRVKLNKVTKL